MPDTAMDVIVDRISELSRKRAEAEERYQKELSCIKQELDEFQNVHRYVLDRIGARSHCEQDSQYLDLDVDISDAKSYTERAACIALAGGDSILST